MPVRNAARLPWVTPAAAGLLLTVDLVAYTWAGVPWLATVAALFGALDLPSADGLRTALGGAAFIGMAGQLVVLNGLSRRTTAGWLLPAAPAAVDGGRPAAAAGVGWTDDR